MPSTPPLPGSTPSAREVEIFTTVVRLGSMKSAAYALGISLPTVKNTLTALYARLEVHGALEALGAMGWLRLPGTCGWLGACGRKVNHRGMHGGFRAVVPVVLGESA